QGAPAPPAAAIADLPGPGSGGAVLLAGSGGVVGGRGAGGRPAASARRAPGRGGVGGGAAGRIIGSREGAGTLWRSGRAGLGVGTRDVAWGVAGVELGGVHQ